MMKLIIAEKPSLAVKIVTALSKTDYFKKEDGYFKGNTFIISGLL